MPMFRGSPQIIQPTVSSTFICAEGDSITQNLASGIVTYPKKFAPDSSVVTLVNQAHAGNQLAALVGRQAADIALIASNPGFSNYIYTAMIGVNETGNATYFPNGATQFATDLAAVCDAIKAGGYTKVLVSTLPDFQVSVENEAWREAINAAIIGLYPAHVDGVIDYANASPMGGNPGVSRNYSLYSDGLHPTDLGQTHLERLYALTVNSVIAGSVAPGAPANLRSIYVKPTMAYLEWDYPTSGGYTSSFSIQYRVSGSGGWTTFTQDAAYVKSIRAYIKGLTPGTSYDFRVAAVGPYGTSGYAEKSYSTPSSLSNTFDTQTNVQNTGVIFSGGNLVATAQPQVYVALARTNIGKSSGKWYVEIRIISGPNIGVALCDDTYPMMPLGLGLGTFTNTALYSAVTGFTLVNAPNADLPVGTVAQLAFDCDNRKAWFGKSGVWENSGNPATGANPWVTWSTDRTIYPCVSVNYDGDSVEYFGGTPSLSVPSGFSALS